MQEPERYINSGCEPTVYERTISGVRWVIAYRDIGAGEELTFDSCINGFGNVEWDCLCGHPKCRNRKHSDFFRLPENKLMEYLPLLDEWFLEWKRDEVEALRRRFAHRFANPS